MLHKIEAMKARYKYVLGRRNGYPTKLELEVYAGKEMRTYVNVGYDIPVNMWDVARQEVKGRMPNSASINRYLRQVVEKIEARELQCIEEGRPFTKDQVRLAFSGKSQYPFPELFDKYITERHKSGKIRASPYGIIGAYLTASMKYSVMALTCSTCKMLI